MTGAAGEVDGSDGMREGPEKRGNLQAVERDREGVQTRRAGIVETFDIRNSRAS